MTLIRLPDNPTDGAKRTLTPPIGLWSIREITFCHVIDLNVSEMQGIEDDIVGYSLSYPSQESSLDLVRSYVRAKREVLGGPHGGLMEVPGMISHYGPGESFFAKGYSDFEFTPYPQFSPEDILPYWDEKRPFGLQSKTDRWMPVEFSRGCHGACGYCAMPKFWGSWQDKDLDIIDDYLGYLRYAIGVEEIIVLDDNIAFNMDYFMAVMRKLATDGFQWSAPNGIYAEALMETDVLKALQFSRCTALSLPFETGCGASARLMGLGRKFFPFTKANVLVNRLRDIGIRTTGFFIIGYPGETERDVKETLAYANALALDERHIYFATPYRGTRLYDLCVEKHYIESHEKTATYKTPVISTPWLSRERLFELWREDRNAALQRKGLLA
jgi:radical SAM superfamily enzyme YgiQ (UPF0313 family)